MTAEGAMSETGGAATRTVTQGDIDAFAALSGDDNPIHVDPSAASRSRFGKTIAHGMLLATRVSGALAGGVDWPWRAMAVGFPEPTPAGSEITVTLAPEGESAEVRVTADGTAVCEGVAAASAEGLPDGALAVPHGEAPTEGPWASIVGRRAEHTWTVTDDDLAVYGRLAGAEPPGGWREVPLPLITAAFSRLLGRDLPGHGTIYLSQSVALPGPVPVGAPLTASVEVARVRPAKGLVDLVTECRAGDGERVAEGRALVLASEVPGLAREGG